MAQWLGFSSSNRSHCACVISNFDMKKGSSSKSLGGPSWLSVIGP